MIRSILSAVVNALKALGGFARRVAAAPFVALANVFGGGPGDVPPPQAVSDEADDVPAAQDLKSVYEQIAVAVMQWCVDSLVAGGPAPVPPRIPRGIAEWLQGLTREECIALGSADRMAVSAHLRGDELAPGVRSVRTLDAVEWPPEPAVSTGPGEVISDRAYAETEPSAAALRAP